MPVNYLRQLEVFVPESFGHRKVTIIGAGATGSYVALLTAQIGIQNIDVWDHDIVEEHNLPNQIYFLHHVGLNKVDALKNFIMNKCGFEISIHKEKVERQDIRPGSYVFLLVDSMKSRKEIFENCIRGKCLNTGLVIETRMGPDSGRIYAFNPNSVKQVQEWVDTLYPDDQAQVSACGATISIAPTASMLASMAVWKMIHHFDVNHGQNKTKKAGKDEEPFNEVIFQVGPENIFSRRFATI
jgi:molybdopterin/thiamine biosynthesis adenylyltransferase